MNGPLFLKQYAFSVPMPLAAQPASIKKHNKVSSRHLFLLKVVIDFENGSFRLEGDWQFIVAANRDRETAWLNFHSKRIFIDAAIYPARSVDLEDNENDSLILLLEGRIEESKEPGSCSGLLIVDCNGHGNGPKWTISFYPYDLQRGHCEIKFRLPVYITSSTNFDN